MPAPEPHTCPECGTANPPHRTLCRQCGALLRPERARRPRIQRKILYRTDFLSAARANRANTTRLILILLGIAAVLGYLVGWNLQLIVSRAPVASPSEWGIVGAMILFGISVVWTGIALNTGDRIVLRLADAHPVTAAVAPQLHNVVEEIAIAAGIPKPRVFIMETGALNAFATGMRPQAASVVVTRGLLDTLSRDELQGVIGHELGHIINWDIRYATAVAVLVGLIALVSDGVLRTVGGGSRQTRGSAAAWVLLLIFALLAPLAAVLVQMAISRQREFLADATSVRLTRNPLGLISALEKLAHANQPLAGANRAIQHLYIVNPVHSFGEAASALFATHPPIALRIQRLRNLGAG
jgi:heat shock protein HtpX